MTNNKESLYIKACVIANGVQDQQGDVITKTDIKRIFTNSIDVGFDINHDSIRQDGIYSMEQYISKSDEMLCDNIVPAGSWMTVLRVDNKDVQQMIKKHEINGVSITAYPERGTEIKRTNPRLLLYKDIQEKDRIHPKEISLVEKPSNRLPLEVMEYETYLSKSEKENTQMTETQDRIEKQSTVSRVLDMLQEVLSASIQKGEDDINVDISVEPEDNTPANTETEESTEETEEVEEENEEEPVEEQAEEEETEETEDSSEENEPVEKMMPPDPQQNTGGATAEQALVQIAQICAKVLQVQQQQAPQQPNGIMQSEDPDPQDPIIKEEAPLKEKVTSKMDKSETTQTEVDRAALFAAQTGRDPITGEKL